jgi:hypothetical protein
MSSVSNLEPKQRTEVIVRAFADQPVRLKAYGKDVNGHVVVEGTDGATMLWLATEVYQFNAELFRELKRLYSEKRDQLDQLWRTATPY